MGDLTGLDERSAKQEKNGWATYMHATTLAICSGVLHTPDWMSVLRSSAETIKMLRRAQQDMVVG